jgi:preprotein translocase subunit SecD
VAPPVGTLRVGRYFLALALIIAVLYAIVFWPGQRHTPKLGIDLVGGTEVTFTAKTPNGGAPSKSAMQQAKDIMTNRVNGTGVSESTVAIQGGNQLIVDIPKSANTNVADLGKAAVLTMRGMLLPPQVVACGAAAQAAAPSSSASSGATPTTTPSGTTTPTGTTPTSGSSSSQASTKDEHLRKLAPTQSATPTPKSTPTKAPSASSTSSPAAAPAPKCEASPLQGLSFPLPNAESCKDSTAPKKNCVGVDTLKSDQLTALQGALAKTDCTKTTNQPDDAPVYVACESLGGGAAYAMYLGPTIVSGRQIDGATAEAPNVSQGQTAWTVNLNLKDSGQASWSKWTSAHNLGGSNASVPDPTQCSPTGTSCSIYVGFVLDGQVISAPGTETAIPGKTTQISGSFTAGSAKKLANQLKYGALPLSFTAQDAVEVSATLGSSQLKAGLLAGGIGLILVVLYSLVYYRALGLVTIASLLVSGALTYGSLVMLGTQIGFTLSLAGIAGFIVAVGITADSFVVFFERMKDEVHEGRSARVAIPRAWVRARRTILSADTVSFLAAAILYYFAAGDVRGFAFTLGLSTILDLIVVFLFTHPLVSLLSRLRTFGSARFTGLDAIRGKEDVVATAAPAPQRRRASSRGAARPAAAPGSVAVLDKADERRVAGVDDLVDTVDAAPADEADPRDEQARADLDAVQVEDDGEPGGETVPRRRTAPAAGSAAERAAARRARLRQQREDGDQS